MYYNVQEEQHKSHYDMKNLQRTEWKVSEKKSGNEGADEGDTVPGHYCSWKNSLRFVNDLSTRHGNPSAQQASFLPANDTQPLVVYG